MKITPIHHVPMKPEYKSPFSAAYAVEDAKLVFFSGCCTVPVYHKHPHDPADEAQWLAGDMREQTERTFAHIGEVLKAAHTDFSKMLKLNIYVTDMREQDVINEISSRYFDPANPPARTFIMVPALAHPNMLIEVEGIAAAPKSTE